MRRRQLSHHSVSAIACLLATLVTPCSLLSAQEAAGQAQEEEEGQSRESMAVDSTAAQWSFQVAYEWYDWHTDEIAPGVTRPEGNKNAFQLRVAAPVPVGGITILPRFTLCDVEGKTNSSGMGSAELFALIVPVEWATGRFGIGPQINFPADEEELGSTAWRYGFATALIQRAAQDKVLFGVLVQQSWGKTDASRPDEVVASALAINPFVTIQLGGGYYLHNGEMVLSREWTNGKWLIPIGIRFGKLWVTAKGLGTCMASTGQVWFTRTGRARRPKTSSA
jgi:hypothetical protein